MLYIYRSGMIKKGINCIWDVELAFSAMHMKMKKYLKTDRSIKSIISDIDGSIYENNVLYTRFGETSISECSSGCKTAILVYLYNLNWFVEEHGVCYINVAEAGNNAMKVILEMSVNNDIYVHCNRIIPLKYRHGSIILEGKEIKDFELIGVMDTCRKICKKN